MKKFKIAFLPVLSLIVVLSLLLSACSNTVEPETAEEPIILRWNMHSPPSGIPWDAAVNAETAIEERTNGRVDVELYSVGLLSDPKQSLEALRTGVSDIHGLMPTLSPGVFPLSEVITIPGVGSGDHRIDTQILNELMPKYLAEEWETGGVELICFCMLGYFDLWSSEPIYTLDDLKGIKTRSVTDSSSKALEILGAIPLTIPGSDVYVSLQKGLADAALFDPTAVRAEHLEEVLNYGYKLNFCTASFGYSMNIDTYNNLPNDIREIVVEEIENAAQWMVDTGYDSLETEYSWWTGEAGKEIITFSGEDLALMNQQLDPLLEDWIAEQEEAGVENVRDFVNDFISLRDKYVEANK